MTAVSDLTADDLPLPQVAADLQCSYWRARELGLRGLIRLRWVGTRVYASKASLREFKAAQKRQMAGAR